LEKYNIHRAVTQPQALREVVGHPLEGAIESNWSFGLRINFILKKDERTPNHAYVCKKMHKQH
jgi:hypothetical protein